jgi:hypothetical protein
MDLARMLQKCRREQWSVSDVDLSRPPRAMPREEEEAVVQYFTDMAVIERLAGALFEEQRRRTEDPVLEEIFATFVVDEVRHAQTAQLLADHYDVHHYRVYQPNPALQRFAPAFVDLIRLLSAEVANTYITTGEIILDVALLRSIADKVDDDTVHDAMERVNRDESRHIAIDFHMVEHYASAAYQEQVGQEPPQPFLVRMHAWFALLRVLRYARPFMKGVFFEPMEACDPSGKRIREAFKRMQLLAAKPEVAKRPFSRFLLGLKDVYNHPVLGPILGGVAVRLTGVDPQVLATLHTEEEALRARHASYDQLAAETVALKFAPP